jgi:hypothetical protein
MPSSQTASVDSEAQKKEIEWYNNFLKMKDAGFKPKHTTEEAQPPSTDEQLAASKERLKQRKATVDTLLARATERLGANLPQSLTNKFAELKTLLASNDEATSAKIDETFEKSNQGLQEIESSLDELTSARALWLAKLGVFETRFAGLEHHAHKAEPAVQQRIGTIKSKRDQAKASAEKHEYSAASDMLRTLTDECAEAEKLADACAHYHGILQDRETRVSALTNPSNDPDVANLIAVTKKRFEDAKTLAASSSPDYAKAVEALVPLAKECIDVAWISDRAEAYNKKRGEVKGCITKWEQQTNVPQVATWLGPFKTLYDESDYQATKDYTKSLVKLNRAMGMNDAIIRASKANMELETVHSMASDLIYLVENEDGNEGIQKEIERLRGDLLFAEEKKKAGEFATATKLCASIRDAVPALQERAKKCAAYLEKKREVAQAKKGWGAASPDIIADLSAQVEKFEALAAGKAAAKDHDGAIAQLEEAMSYAKKASLQAKFLQRNDNKDFAKQYTFDQLHETADTQCKNLPATDVSAELQDAWKTIGQHLLQAKNSAGEKDLNAAHGHLAMAKEKLVKAAQQAKDYKAYEALRKGAIKELMDKLDTTEGLAALGREVGVFKTAVAKAAALAGETKVDEALDTLQKTKKDGDILASMLVDYGRARTAEKEYVTDHLRKVSLPRVADIKAEVEKMQTRLAEMFKGRQFKQAENFTFNIYLVLEKAGKIIQDHMKFMPERTKAVQSIKDLKDVQCDAIAEDVNAVEKALEKADAEADARNYQSALQLVEQIQKDCVAPLRIGMEYKDYPASLKKAMESIERLSKDHRGMAAVELRIRELNEQLAGAEELAAKKEYGKARVETDGIPDAAQDVRKVGQNQSDLDKLQSEPDLKKKLAEVISQYKKLKVHPGVVALSKETKAIDEALMALKTLQTAPVKNPADIKAALAKAATNLAAGNQLADQWIYVDAKLKAAITRAGNLRTTHAEPVSTVRRLDTLDKELTGVIRPSVDGAEFDNALNLLRSAETEMNAIEAVAKAHAAYTKAKEEIQKTVDKLSKHKGRYAVTKELGEAQTQLVNAGELAETGKHTEAMAALAEAERICDVAEIQADMHEIPEGANATPEKLAEQDKIKEEKIKALLAKKDGAEQLDKIIATLDPQTQRKACQKALELRFDMKLKQYRDKAGADEDTASSIPGPEIMRLYKVMKSLPNAHTKNNPSVQLVKRFDANDESEFNKFSKVIELRVGRATEKFEEEIGQEWQLGEVDEKCTPVAGKPPKKFSWTTLHEIGHAVDDMLGYMSKNGETRAGWQEYGADVGEIATAAAKEFKYNKGYIESYLSNPGGRFPLPAPDADVEQEIWDQQRIAAETWCDSIRSGRKIWNSASDAARLKIGDKVYQEAYPNKWVSYNFSARSQGVTGYQFRAPGEWFAELYAAYHTKKMNPKHPARAWLDEVNKD